MKNYLYFLSLLIVALSFTSCATIQPNYVPKLSLDVSPKTINKTVRIEQFRDTSPEEDRDIPSGGVSVTNNKVISFLGYSSDPKPSLEISVTEEIISDFSFNGVFKHASGNAQNPDYIIRGEIMKFKGITKLNTVRKIAHVITGALFVVGIVTFNITYLSYFGYAFFMDVLYPLLGVPITRNLTEVVILLNVYDKDNNLVATCRGGAFSDIVGNIYDSFNPSIRQQTNDTFEDVVMQLREQIISQLVISN